MDSYYSNMHNDDITISIDLVGIGVITVSFNVNVCSKVDRLNSQNVYLTSLWATFPLVFDATQEI